MYFAAAPFMDLYNANLETLKRFNGFTPSPDSTDSAEDAPTVFDLASDSITKLGSAEYVAEWTKNVFESYWKFASDFTELVFQPFIALASAASEPGLML